MAKAKQKRPVQKTENPATKAAGITDEVAQKRKRQAADNFPRLERSQFPSEQAYREALLQQYHAMRQQEYQYVCLNEGIKAYDVSLTICNRTGNSKAMNTAAWNGCQNIMKTYPDMREEVSDSCYVRIPTVVTNSLNDGHSYNCCGVSSKALESKISAEMGFDGKNNFVQPYHQQPAAACHRAADGFKNDPNCAKYYIPNGNLWKLISDGKVGPGATIAIPSGRTESNYHAKTVVAVNYDENGKLKSYVLQGNNQTSFEVVSSSEKYKHVGVADMNRWMNDKLNNEMQQQRSLSTDEMARMVERERQQLNNRIDDLEQSENHLFQNQGRQRQVGKYAEHYIKNANVPDATPEVMKIDAKNAADKQRQEEEQLRRTAAQTRTSGNSKQKPATTTQNNTQTSVQRTSTSAPAKTQTSIQRTSAPAQAKTQTSIRRTSAPAPTKTQTSIQRTSAPAPTKTQTSAQRTSAPAPTKTQTSAQRTSASAPTKTGNASEKDKARMRSMLKNLNKANGKSRQVDIDATIEALTAQYGENASKVLTKAMMAPTSMKIRDKDGKVLTTSRQVIQRLCEIEDEQQKSNVVTMATAARNRRSR